MAAKRPTHVPKFGNWDANDHMPYTAVFDHARAGKVVKPGFNPNDPVANPEAFGRGRPFNPNDPADNPEAFGLTERPTGPMGGKRVPPASEMDDAVPVPPRGRHERRASREEAGFGRPAPAEVPGRNAFADPGRNPFADQRRPGPEMPASRPQPQPEPRHPVPPTQPARGPIVGGPGRTGSGGVPNGGSDRSNGSSGHGSTGGSQRGGVDQSPVHPQAYQQRFGRAGGNSPSRAPDPVFAPATPTRSRMGQGGRPGDGGDRSAALPKFGDWNSKDASCADGFTIIFDNKIKEKTTGGVGGRAPPVAEAPARPSADLYSTPGRDKKQHQESKWYDCFLCSKTVD